MMPDLVSDLAEPVGTVFTRDDARAWFAARYPRVKAGTIAAHLERFSTNSPSRLSHAVRPEEDVLFKLDSARFRRYDPSTDPRPLHKDAIPPEALAPRPSPSTPTIDEEDLPQGPSEFAYESDLRDFLARNLGLIEKGLTLYTDEGIDGVEFPVGGRYVDILAADRAGQLVVIELKVSRGHERTVGQLLRYMAWIAKHQAEPGQRVRGIIVAREISNDLRLACAYVPHVTLFEYQLAVTLKPVEVEQLPVGAPVP